MYALIYPIFYKELSIHRVWYLGGRGGPGTNLPEGAKEWLCFGGVKS